MINFLNVLSGTEFISAGIAIVLVLIISLSLHEFAHAYVAYSQGDITPKVNGRVTINPFAHIDAIGFICCVLFGFGWAKPVEINPVNFRNYRKGYVLTSIAGVIVNLILAFIGCGFVRLCLKLSILIPYWLFTFLYFFFEFLYIINLSLFVFNLLPIYPLDGFNVINGLTKYDNKFVNFMRRYGNLILIVILIFGDGLMFTLVNWIGYPIELLWSLIIR